MCSASLGEMPKKAASKPSASSRKYPFWGDTVQNPCVKRTPLSSGPPSIRWNLAGRVYLLQQKVPECSWTVDPPGRPAWQTNDGDVVRSGLLWRSVAVELRHVCKRADSSAIVQTYHTRSSAFHAIWKTTGRQQSKLSRVRKML